MSDVNKIILLGNLTANPEPSPDGGRTTMRVATGRWRSDTRETETTYHRVVVFGKRADVIADHLKKGARVYVEGRLSVRKYVDQNGVEKWSTDIVVDPYNGVVEFQPRGNGNGGGSPQPEPYKPDSTEQAFDDDIPF